jgi:hypothetical protein
MPEISNAQIDKLINSLNEIRNFLESIKTKEVARQGIALSANKYKKLIYRSVWPKAVPDYHLVIDSDQERSQRASRMLDQLVDLPLKDKNVLVFHCGPGDLAYAASKITNAVGYNPQSLGWSRFPANHNLKFTTDFDEATSLSPYDVIIHDSLEYSQSPIDRLVMASHLLSDKGRIYLRCHPWSSRHGMDNLRVFNKAFAHLYLTDLELKEMGITSLPTQRVINPETYREWITAAGLMIRRARNITQSVENVFRGSIMSPVLKDLYTTTEFPEDMLKICYIDYILETPQ